MKTTLMLIMGVLMLVKISICELIGVIQVNRHGARTGKNFDSLSSYLFYGSSKTQLTINGFMQHEALGHWIAERYIHFDYNFLTRTYNNDEIIFKSSPSERTIFSGIGFIKGFFPNSKITPVFRKNEDEKIKMKTNDIPPINDFALRMQRPEIPLVVANPDNDKIFHTSSCRVSPFSDEKVSDLLVKKKLYNITEEEIFKAVEDIKTAWPEAFNNKTREEIYTIKFLKFLNGFIRPTQYHFDNQLFNLSNIATSVLNRIQIEKWYGKRVVDSPALRTLVSGIYTEFISYFDIFQKRLNDSNEKLKYVVYSGHDGTLIGIFANLFNRDRLEEMIGEIDQYYDFLQPGFASHLIFELHAVKITGFLKNSIVKFVRVIYNGKVLRDVFDPLIKYDLKLDGIELEAFKSFLSNRIDRHYVNLICQRSESDEDPEFTYLF